MNEAEYLMENYGDLGGCYPPRPTVSTDNTLLDMIQKPNSIIVLLKVKNDHRSDHSSLSSTTTVQI